MAELRKELTQILIQLEMSDQPEMLGMHLAEIEEEADNILDLLVTVRVLGRQKDARAGQVTLAELTVALEHLLHHIQQALPSLQHQLDIADDEDFDTADAPEQELQTA